MPLSFSPNHGVTLIPATFKWSRAADYVPVNPALSLACTYMLHTPIKMRTAGQGRVSTITRMRLSFFTPEGYALPVEEKTKGPTLF